MLEVWDWVCGLDEGQTTQVVKQFMEEQPALGIYLTACADSLGKEADDSRLLDLAVAVWEAMRREAGHKLPKLQPNAIMRAEKANVKMLTRLEPASEIVQENQAREVFTAYNQREVMGFCLEILMSDDEETPELAPERLGMEWVWLKTVIDCLDRPLPA